MPIIGYRGWNGWLVTRAPSAGKVTIHLFGVPENFAASLGLTTG
ncbi:MAG TPA: hypothetical protein VKR83_10255 [Ktedonobacteraceae bacterium]|nr:hypothetical protein [Ktedonobacteraceae bacterium]